MAGHGASRASIVAFALGLAMTGAPTYASAQTRDSGFFLRLSLGVAVFDQQTRADAHEVVPDVASTTVTDTRLTYVQRPAGFVGEVAVGYRPTPRLALALVYGDYPHPSTGYGEVKGNVLGLNARRD